IMERLRTFRSFYALLARSARSKNNSLTQKQTRLRSLPIENGICSVAYPRLGVCARSAGGSD
ncbi:hypothetical protein Q0P01_14290, partial [Staphylococcus aureus]|nr:hypothetical protein [Staphylococcus aureus]